MMGNNITNKQAPFILFDIDSILFNEETEKKTTAEKLKGIFRTEEQKRLEQTFNKFFIARLNRIWHNHNVCIGLVTFDIRKEKYELEAKLSDFNVPYTKLYSLENWSELRELDSIYTFSRNEDLLSFLSQNHAVHYDQLGEILK